MNSIGGTLSFDAVITNTDFKRSIDEIEKSVRTMTQRVVSDTDRIDSQFKKLGQLAAGYFTLDALKGFAQQVVKVRGEFQNLEIAFTTMLRSKSAANELMGQIVQFAGTSPFSLRDVAQGAKQLLAYGSSAKTVINELRTLGDVAAGTSTPIADLIYLYGTLRSQGRAYAVDIRQFAGRGIPIYEELGKVLKINTSEVNGFVEAGKVGFKEVEQAFKNMTSGTGLFAGLMEAQSKSLTGLLERLSDAFDVMLNKIGQANEGVIASLITGATEVVEHYEPILDILKVLVVTYGTYRAALIAAAVAQRTAVVAQNVAAWIQLATSIKSASEAQILFNVATKANPYVLAATAIVGLVSAFVLLGNETEKVTGAQKLIAEASQESASNLAKQSGEIRTLIATVKNQNVAESQRLVAYEKLKAVAPEIVRQLSFQEAKTADLTASTREYIATLKQRLLLEATTAKGKTIYEQQAKSIEDVKKAQEDYLKSQQKKLTPFSVAGAVTPEKNSARSQLEEAIKVQKLADKAAQDFEKSVQEITSGKRNKDTINAQIAVQKQIIASSNKQSLAYKDAEDKLKGLNAELAALGKTETVNQKVQQISIDKLDELIKKQKDAYGAATSDTERNTAKKELERLEAQRRRLTGELTASEKKAAKEADKIGPLGSVSYYETISQKAQEVLDKIDSSNPNNAGKVARQLAIKADADNKAEEARKLITIKSFDDELSDKRDKYELYQRWVAAYSQQSADEQFSDLLKSGQSYFDYLNTQISSLEAKKSKGTLNEKDAKNLGTLTVEKDDITGKKTKIELFQEGLEKARTSASNLAEYLVILKQKQDDLYTKKPTQKNDYDERKQLAEEILKTQTELQSRLNQFLVSYASSGEQQLSIQKEFAEKRAALDLRYNGKKGEDYKKALAIINTAEKEALAEFQQRKLEETDEYKNTTKVILDEGRKRLKIEIANQAALVARAKQDYGENSEVYKRAKESLNRLEKELGGENVNKFSGYSALVNEFGQALIDLGGDAAQVGQKLLSITSSAELISASFKKGVTDAELYSTAIQGTIAIFSAITTAAAERKKVESDYYESLIAQQQEYNLLLNDQATQRTKKEENVFVKNYARELEDGFKKYDNAQENYQKALKKLEEGRAKSGLKDTLDSKKALDLIGKGAGTGAAIGTLIAPGIGTAIGAVVGGIVGSITALFGGAKKKEAEFGNLLSLYPELIQKSKDGVDELNTALAESLIKQNLLDDATKATVQSVIDWQKKMDEARTAIKAVISDLASGLGDNLRNSLVTAFKDGTDAAQAFKKSVSEIMDDLVTKMLFSKAFNGLFEQLEKDLSKSLDIAGGGDNNVIDDFSRFTDNSKDALAQFNDWLKAYQDAAKANGFDVLQGNKTNANNSMQGAIKGVTEETASVLAGQINAIRIYQAETGLVIRNQLIVLSGIEKNTGATVRSIEELSSEVGIVRRGLQAKGFL